MKRLFPALLLTFSLFGHSTAWWTGAHDILTVAAVQATPEVPDFFKNGEAFISHMVYDPDVVKNYGTPSLREAEYGEHFADLELIEGKPLPARRYAFIRLCDSLGVEPEKVGLVPYALAEWTERLAVAFAEHRKWPKNPFIQAKCQVFAGILAHYAQDASQPLHLTIHYNGRKLPDGSVEQKGIHAKVDGLPLTLEMKPEDLAKGLQVAPLDSLMEGIVDQIDDGFKLVDYVYELGPRIPSFGQKDWERDEQVITFAVGRARESVRFTATLFLTAWKKSAGLELPDWLDLRSNPQE
jgi:hypothetical protein